VATFTVTGEYAEYFEVQVQADSIEEAKDKLVETIGDYSPSDGGWSWLKAELETDCICGQDEDQEAWAHDDGCPIWEAVAEEQRELEAV